MTPSPSYPVNVEPLTLNIPVPVWPPSEPGFILSRPSGAKVSVDVPGGGVQGRPDARTNASSMLSGTRFSNVESVTDNDPEYP